MRELKGVQGERAMEGPGMVGQLGGGGGGEGEISGGTREGQGGWLRAVAEAALGDCDREAGRLTGTAELAGGGVGVGGWVGGVGRL